MSISEDKLIYSYLKDKSVRNILQSIQDQILVRRKPEILARTDCKNANQSKIIIVLRFKSNGDGVQFIDLGDRVINASDFTDRLFLQWLKEAKIIGKVQFEWLFPKYKEGVVTQTQHLEILESWRSYEYLVSFTIEDETAIKKLYNRAIDALTDNPYPVRDQENILYATILNIKNCTKQAQIVLTRNEIDKKDLPHIKIFETLHGLEKLKKIEIKDIVVNLTKTNEHGDPYFRAIIACAEPLPFAISHNCLFYRSFVLDLDSQKAVYIKAKNNNITYSPKKDRRCFLLLKAFLTKQGEPRRLDAIDVYRSMFPNQKQFDTLQPEQRKKNKWALNYLRRKFKNKRLIKKFGDSWEFDP